MHDEDLFEKPVFLLFNPNDGSNVKLLHTADGVPKMLSSKRLSWLRPLSAPAAPRPCTCRVFTNLLRYVLFRFHGEVANLVVGQHSGVKSRSLKEQTSFVLHFQLLGQEAL